jgi:hypothetical protein
LPPKLVVPSAALPSFVQLRKQLFKHQLDRIFQWYLCDPDQFLRNVLTAPSDLALTASFPPPTSLTLTDGSVLITNFDKLGANLTQILPVSPVVFIGYSGFASGSIKALWSTANSSFVVISRDILNVDRFHYFTRADEKPNSGAVCLPTNGSSVSMQVVNISGTFATSVLNPANSTPFMGCKAATSYGPIIQIYAYPKSYFLRTVAP